MIQSMTGFGKAEVDFSEKKITVEIKSLNSKQFDVNTRIPTAYKGKDNEWIRKKKVIFTADAGSAYETATEQGSRVSDLVFGDVLGWEGEAGRFFRVAYPDGRQGYVLRSESRLLEDWMASLRPDGESIVKGALRWKGIPYTWGGTSVKAFDCSGFVKTVYGGQGILLRRDASQQAATGLPVDVSAGYGQLLAGDLLFFGRRATEGTKERVRHVAIYAGNGEFIHAAGFVRVNSLDPAQPHYDAANAEELIRATRIVGAVGSAGIWAVGESPLCEIQP
jgi:hypothetical protein